jgi:hypothetical protein
MNRPKIKNFFDKKTDIKTVHSEYTKSPHLYNYSNALDTYIDYLEEKLYCQCDYPIIRNGDYCANCEKDIK